MNRRTARTLATLIVALAMFAMAGCKAGPCPELAVYREGLHPLDEAMYNQHAAVVHDAVKAGIRTAVDEQVVAAEISQARHQYQASHDGATTKPAN